MISELVNMIYSDNILLLCTNIFVFLVMIELIGCICMVIGGFTRKW